jgi:hypothetical protein
MPKLFKTDVASDADLRVAVADVRSEADLIVFETVDAWAATEPGIWTYTDVRSEADKVICFVDAPWDADLVIFRTEIQPEAGWQSGRKAGLFES